MKTKIVKALTFLSALLVFTAGMVSFANNAWAQAGQEKLGEPCVNTAGVIECQGGTNLYCDDITNTCQVKGAVGKSCSGLNGVATDALCSSGQKCDTTTKRCVSSSASQGSEYTACGSGNSCNTGLTCKNNICVKEVKAGTSCINEADCSPLSTNLHCRVDANNKKVCLAGTTASVSSGGTCSTSKDCTGDLACNNGKCLTTTAANSCSSNADCSGNQICSKASNVRTTAYCTNANGSTCKDSRECPFNSVCTNGKCAQGAGTIGKEGSYCAPNARIPIPCDSPLVCENEKCVKPAATSTNTNTPNINASFNLQCDRAANKGLFTQNVSNACVNCGQCSICDVANAVVGFGNNLLGFAAPLAGLFLIIGGILYMTAAGNPERTGRAKQTIAGAIIGLIIMLAAYLIVTGVLQGIGASNAGSFFSPSYQCPANAWQWTGFGT